MGLLRVNLFISYYQVITEVICMNISKEYLDAIEKTRENLIGSLRRDIKRLIVMGYKDKMALGGNDIAITGIPDTRAIPDSSKLIIKDSRVYVVPSLESWIYTDGIIKYHDSMRKISKEVSPGEVPFESFKVESLLDIAENIEEALGPLE